MEDRIGHALENSAELGEYGVLMMLGLDLFQQMSDSLGHACGNRVLVQVVQRIRSIVLDGGILCRISGDTFVLMAEHLGVEGIAPSSRLRRGPKRSSKLSGPP